MSESVTVKLKKPIVQGEGDKAVTLTELTFREATTGDACRADLVKGDFTKMLAILSGMAGIDLPTMQKLGVADFNTIVAKVGELMGEPVEAEETGTIQ